MAAEKAEKINKDLYRKVKKEKDDEEKPGNEIRVSTREDTIGLIKSGIKVFENEKVVTIKGLGAVVSKTIVVAEMIKRRVKGLHQTTTLEPTTFVDKWEPINEPKEGEEKLPEKFEERTVPLMTIVLSKDELDTKHMGYQKPLPEEEVEEGAAISLPSERREAGAKRDVRKRKDGGRGAGRGVPAGRGTSGRGGGASTARGRGSGAPAAASSSRGGKGGAPTSGRGSSSRPATRNTDTRRQGGERSKGWTEPRADRSGYSDYRSGRRNDGYDTRDYRDTRRSYDRRPPSGYDDRRGHTGGGGYYDDRNYSAYGSGYGGRSTYDTRPRGYDNRSYGRRNDYDTGYDRDYDHRGYNSYRGY